MPEIDTLVILTHVAIALLMGYTLILGIPKAQWTYKQGREYLDFCQRTLAQEYYRIKDVNRQIKTYEEMIPAFKTILNVLLGVNIAYFLFLIIAPIPMIEEIKFFLMGATLWGGSICIQVASGRYLVTKVVNDYHAMVREQEQQEQLAKDPNPKTDDIDNTKET